MQSVFWQGFFRLVEWVMSLLSKIHTRGLPSKIFSFIGYAYIPVQINQMTTSQEEKT
jgi:hypothetical protein